MHNDAHAFADRRALLWAAAAVLSGCALLVVMDAPARMPMMNGAAFLIGLALLGVLHAAKRLGADARQGDWAVICLALILPATALAGPEMNGVSRWLVLGGITIQPALIITPLLALAFCARRTLTLLLAVAVASVGLTMQPDPGAAAMLLFGLSAPLALRGNRSAIAAWAAIISAAALAISLARAVSLPPVAFVEQMLTDAVAQGPLPALLALLSVACLFLPARAGSRRTAYAFAGVWAGALGASLVGDYPTPVVGFGGSAVLGYVLSVGFLIAIAQKEFALSTRAKARGADEDNGSLRFA